MAQIPISNSRITNARAWQWLVDGWHTLRDKTMQAITYFAPEEGAQASQRWGVLATDVVEKDATIELELELPGMDKADLCIEVINDHLVVAGRRRTSNTRREGTLLVTERAYGEFRRTLALPCAVDSAKTKAAYKDGVLSISLPKHPALLARSIPVEQG